MASLSAEIHVCNDGTRTTTYRVLFVDQSGRRQTIRLGSVSKKIAETTKCRVEEILAARFSGTSIQPETASWLTAIADVIHEKFAKVGLVEPRQTVKAAREASPPLGEIVERYIASRSKLKPNTLRNYETTKRLLNEHFGEARLVRSIHAGHAKDYREWLVGKYASATVAREIKRARQFFEYAKDCRAIEENPFLKVKAGSQKNTRRKQFVGQDVIEEVLAACPDNDWRLAVVLARYAGLRIPSELEKLTWSDIDWAGQRFTVRVKKKEHLDGHETRVVPIFPEIEPYLRQAFDDAPPGTIHVLPRRFHNEGYVYAGVLRAVERAGVKAWPKLLVNMRASRETELMQAHPAHVVHAWLGNSAEVAADHYLMLTDSDFDRAASPDLPAHYPAHSGASRGLLAPSPGKQTAVSPAFPRDTAVQIPPRGVEPRFSS
ncbi:MAG: site-specific integrase [Planctomycetota bacterium]|nr:MAG: site-specific integrase [Planctomycetota bacterium]